MTAFFKDGYVCIINKQECEAREKFLERGNFIVSQKPKDENEYEENELYSRLYINVKYLNCTYNKQVLDKLDQKCKLIYSDK